MFVEYQAAARSMDLVIDCAAGGHPIDPFLSTLKHGGTLALVGVAPELKLSPTYIVMGKCSFFRVVQWGFKIEDYFCLALTAFQFL